MKAMERALSKIVLLEKGVKKGQFLRCDLLKCLIFWKIKKEEKSGHCMEKEPEDLDLQLLSCYSEVAIRVTSFQSLIAINVSHIY